LSNLGHRPILLAGPTAVGKSDIALALAERIGGEIISVDSMQVYRGLDIGTAKPSAEDRKRVPHHLINVVELTEAFDAASFVHRAAQAIQDIIARGRQPILCGGTGLYFNALLNGLGTAPSGNPRLRAKLDSEPLRVLLAELEDRDPATFQRIDTSNRRRVVRALEVIRLTGIPFSQQRAAWEPSARVPDLPAYGFTRVRDDLVQRIDARVDYMFAAGLVEETKALLRHGLETNRTALQALGYRQVFEHLLGERSLSDTIALIKTRTRQFAKRQMTWFRRQMHLDWIELTRGNDPFEAANLVIARLSRTG
jgi:tRNA dimethylallyltransferase